MTSFLFSVEMTFDPTALRQAVNKKSKTSQAHAPGQKRGQKRPQDSKFERHSLSPGGSSPGTVRVTVEHSTPQGTPQGFLHPQESVEVVDLEDEEMPPSSAPVDDEARGQ